MHGSAFNLPSAAAEQSQLRIWPEATMLDPATKEIVPARIDSQYRIWLGVEVRLIAAGVLASAEVSIDLLLVIIQWRINFLIRVQTQNPIAGGLVDGRVLLRGEAFPFFDEHFRAE